MATELIVCTLLALAISLSDLIVHYWLFAIRTLLIMKLIVGRVRARLVDAPAAAAAPTAAKPAPAAAEVDAETASIRSSHLELNVLPSGMPASLPPLAGSALQAVCESSMPLPGEKDVSREWIRMPGGPHVAHLARKSRQPASADNRVFGVHLEFSSVQTPAIAGAVVKFVVPGVAKGIICNVKPGIEQQWHPLHIAKAVVGGSSVTIDVFYKADGNGEDGEGGGEGGSEGGGEGGGDEHGHGAPR